MADTIAFLIDKDEFKASELRLLKRLYKHGDLVEMLRYERKILEYFLKIIQSGSVIEVNDLKACDAVEQLSLFASSSQP